MKRENTNLAEVTSGMEVRKMDREEVIVWRTKNPFTRTEERSSGASPLLCLLASGSILKKNLFNVTCFIPELYSPPEMRGHSIIHQIQYSVHYHYVGACFSNKSWHSFDFFHIEFYHITANLFTVFLLLSGMILKNNFYCSLELPCSPVISSSLWSSTSFCVSTADTQTHVLVQGHTFLHYLCTRPLKITFSGIFWPRFPPGC